MKRNEGHQFVDARLEPEIDEIGQGVGEPGVRANVVELGSLCRAPNNAEQGCIQHLSGSLSSRFGIVPPLAFCV